jgi:hypothetical protein
MTNGDALIWNLLQLYFCFLFFGANQRDVNAILQLYCLLSFLESGPLQQCRGVCHDYESLHKCVKQAAGICGSMNIVGADVLKSGLRAFHGAPVNKNLPLFLCLLIRN